MDRLLRDFTRVNTPTYTRSMIAEDLEEKCRASIFHDSMYLSRIMLHVKQVVKSRKRNNTRAGNRSRQVEKNFTRKSSIEIRDNPSFKNGLSHQGESSSSKVHYDRDSEPVLRETKQ